MKFVRASKPFAATVVVIGVFALGLGKARVASLLRTRYMRWSLLVVIGNGLWAAPALAMVINFDPRTNGTCPT